VRLRSPSRPADLALPPGFRDIGSGFLPAFGTTGYEPLTLVLGAIASVALIGTGLRGRATRRKYQLEDEPFLWFITKMVFTVALVMYIGFLLASYSGTPIVLVVLAVLVVVYSTVMKNSVFGRHVYAIGGNLHAAELSGIKTKRVTFLLFVNMGVISALAGLVFTGQLNLASPSAGNGF
jgi:putative multiple sugar transport system permease protein